MSLFRSRKVRTVNLAVNKSLSQFVGYAQKEIAFYAVLVAPAVGDRYEKFQFQILCASCVMGASNSDVFVMRYLRLPLLVNGLISRGFSLRVLKRDASRLVSANWRRSLYVHC